MTLVLEYEPEGLVEKVGDALHVVERQAEGDLERFKQFIESEEYATGAWRGSVSGEGSIGTPGVEAAAESRGDSGKAGVSQGRRRWRRRRGGGDRCRGRGCQEPIH